jgi:hypothetical protein
MSNNAIGDAPGALLAEALVGHEGLRRIEFADCGIGNVTSRFASEPFCLTFLYKKQMAACEWLADYHDAQQTHTVLAKVLSGRTSLQVPSSFRLLR